MQQKLLLLAAALVPPFMLCAQTPPAQERLPVTPVIAVEGEPDPAGAKEAPLDAQEQVHTVVDEMPQFPGGEQALYAYLGSNIRYPEMERESEIQGRVYIRFVVETDGAITNVTTLRGVSGGPGLEREAMRVVSAMPKWTPGKMAGKPVRVQYNLPVSFKLTEPVKD